MAARVRPADDFPITSSTSPTVPTPPADGLSDTADNDGTLTRDPVPDAVSHVVRVFIGDESVVSTALAARSGPTTPDSTRPTRSVDAGSARRNPRERGAPLPGRSAVRCLGLGAGASGCDAGRYRRRRLRRNRRPVPRGTESAEAQPRRALSRTTPRSQAHPAGAKGRARSSRPGRRLRPLRPPTAAEHCPCGRSRARQHDRERVVVRTTAAMAWDHRACPRFVQPSEHR